MGTVSCIRTVRNQNCASELSGIRKVNVEFVELYNDDIFDLLRSDSNKITLRDTGNDITLVDAKSESVDNSLDLMHVVKRGWQSRRTAATAMNRDSSRSHALLIIQVCTEEVTGSLKCFTICLGRSGAEKEKSFVAT
uniref:Kinesin motor domain-containing protein n=1 Tax=Caenorhabditis japonica TaxID=281687 RepID=A0A8R1EHE5_CAEJA